MNCNTTHYRANSSSVPGDPTEAPDWRRWFKGTAAHNTVLVDGLDQTPYRRSKPKGAPATGRLLGRGEAPGLDLIVAEALSPAYDARHVRSVLFVADEYWLLHDRLTAATAHDYDLRFHLAPEATGQTEICLHRGQWVVRAPGLLLLCEGASRPQIEPGWYAPTYGTKLEAPIISVRCHAAHTDFLTLILPAETGAPIPTLEVLHRQGADAAFTVEIAGVARGTASDRLVLRHFTAETTPEAPAVEWVRHYVNGVPNRRSAVETIV